MSTRLLLVDDSEVYRSTLELVLARETWCSVAGAVADGEAALRACDELEPDLVLLDYRLPDVDGTRLTAAVLEARPGIAVLCLTAEASPAERAAVLAAGAAEVVEKGDLEELLAAVRRVAGIA